MLRTLKAADLFCGAGGASNGLQRACTRLGVSLDLLAINHWPLAVETHKANHPHAHHLCEELESVNPRVVVPGGKLDLLLAGPEYRAQLGEEVHASALAFHDAPVHVSVVVAG